MRNQTRHKKTGHKVLSIRQGRTVIFERWDINEISPIIIPGYCLETISRLWSSEGNPGRAQWSPKYRTQSWASGEAKEAPVRWAEERNA